MRFTQEQIARAKEIPVEGIARYLGYTVIKKGNYFSLKEMDSLMINTTKNLWWRYSNGMHGNSIDFMMKFGNLNFYQAVQECLDIGNINYDYDSKIQRKCETSNEYPQNKKMKLPQRSDKFQRLYAYLIKKRKLSVDTIQFFINQKILYEESKYHNMVFLGRDKKGKIQYAGIHGTLELNGKKAFRGDVAGNNKSYGVNVRREDSNSIVVFEAVIDLMSYFEIQNKITGSCKENLLALGMLADLPLETFLKENQQIKKIIFALDHDEKGREATDKLMKKYHKKGYKVREYVYPGKYKDINDYLKMGFQGRKIPLTRGRL